MGKQSTVLIPEKSPRRVGIVESDARNKTRKVVVQWAVRHPKYGKYVRQRTVLHVHDAENESRLGDTVEVATSTVSPKRDSFSASWTWRTVRCRTYLPYFG